jgi:glutamine synthetase
VSRVDAMMRITLGLTGVAWGTSRMIRHPHSSTPLLVTIASAMKVAEGVTRFCPMLALFNTTSNRLREKAQASFPIRNLPQRLEKAMDSTEYDEFEPHH